jgi:hypothetical protein|nr:MAG TPA: hypothetical protein [Caudoviricetes sp.]
MKLIGVTNTLETVSIKTKYGSFVIPEIFISNYPVYVALEPYGNPADYEFSVVLLVGDSREYTFGLGWIAEHDSLVVAIVRFTKEEIGREPKSPDWYKFITNSLCDVTPVEF